MKFKDYYQVLGVDRAATAEQIKKAYRKLAHQYHPDISKEKGAEERFKEVGEAYDTLKNPEKRAAYDQLGRHRPGQEFTPPPDWQQHFGGSPSGFEDVDLADLLASLAAGARRGGARPHFAARGQDYEVTTQISLEDAYLGREIDLELQVPEYRENGLLHQVPRTYRVRIPKGVSDGQRLRLSGKGGKGLEGGHDGDLYLTILLASHPLFRPQGHDLYMDLALAPWEAVLGSAVVIPTLAGSVELKIPAGTRAGHSLRLAGKGMPKARGGFGDLHAVVQIVVPTHVDGRERELFEQLAKLSRFDPRSHLGKAH